MMWNDERPEPVRRLLFGISEQLNFRRVLRGMIRKSPLRNRSGLEGNIFS